MMDEDMEVYEEDTQEGKYLTFQSGNEFFGLEIRIVHEIIGIQKIAEIPETEDYIKGLINLRGKIIPVIDVRIRFKQEPFEYTDRTCIIIISVKDTIVGLIVEKIADVVTINKEEVTPPPSLTHGNAKNKYVYGLGKVGDNVKMLLDPEKMIMDNEITLFERVTEETYINTQDGRSE